MIRRYPKRLCPIAILPVLLLLGADSDTATPAGPTSTAAVTVIKRHDHTVDEAAKVFELARKKADTEAIRQLKLIERDAMRAGNLAEADAIEAKCKSWSADSGDAADARALLGVWTIVGQKWLIGGNAIKHPDGEIEKPTWQGSSAAVKWGTGFFDRFMVLPDGLILHEGWTTRGHRPGVDLPDVVEEGTKAD